MAAWKLLTGHVARGRQRLLPLHVVLVDHAVLHVPVDDGLPLLGQGALLALQRLVQPRLDGGEQRPLGEPAVRGLVVQRALGEDGLLHGRPEDLVQVQVDGMTDAVEVHVLVHVEAGVEERAQRFEGALVERETVRRAERVVDEAVDVDRTQRDAAHVRVAPHVVHVVDRDRAREGAVQQPDPAGYGTGIRGGACCAARPFLRPDEERHVPGVHRLVGAKRPRRAAAQLRDESAELVDDEVLRDLLVVDPEHGLEVLLVAEVAERTVAEVVQQPGQPQGLFDQRQGGRAGLDLGQRGVHLPRELPGEVHGAEAVREAAVLGGREHPPGALQLVDPLQPLHPGTVDDVRLGDLAGPGQRDAQVPVQRVGDEVDVVVRESHRGVLTASVRRLRFARRGAARRRPRARPRTGRCRTAPPRPCGTRQGRSRRCAAPPPPSRRRSRR